ncbi:MAG: 30S ribosomal protein S2 [Ignavibacterium sp.]|nr:30S ribosomal protein S2 [Ignavibacterium sp.]
MKKVDITALIEGGAHFGHLTRRWNPKMKPYIFMEKNGIHIIDLKKTQGLLAEAAEELSKLVADGKRVLFVGTKKQAKNIIETEARRCGMNWVSERWLGGMLTNFSTIRKSIKRLNNIEKQETDGTFDKITKKERLFLTREKDKLKKVLEGVESMNKIPGAIFIVDIKKEDIAVKEAHRLKIPVFAIVDTNCDPDEADYVIPANDDAVKTIEIITGFMADSILEGEAKLKEIKAEEAAEKERLRKEREAEKAEEAAAKEKLRKELAEKKAEEKRKAEAEKAKKAEESKAEQKDSVDSKKNEGEEKSSE